MGQQSWRGRLRPLFIVRMSCVFQSIGAVLLVVVALLSIALPVSIERLNADTLTSARFTDRFGVPLAEEVGAVAQMRRQPVPLDRVAADVTSVLIYTEDRRFFHHGGVDVRATLRALLQNARAGRVLSGGSTLTQQLARLILGYEALAEHSQSIVAHSSAVHVVGSAVQGGDSPHTHVTQKRRRRGLWQKIEEAHLAMRLEQSFSKKEILSAYLNQAFFGQNTIGIQAAATRYFDTDAASLSLAQSAFLIGLLRGPSAYDPLRHFSAAKARQERLLRAMRSAGRLSTARFDRAMLEVLSPRRTILARQAVHAIELAKREFLKAGERQGCNALSGNGISNGGVRDAEACLAVDKTKVLMKRQGRASIGLRGEVRLTIDASLQADVESILSTEIERIYQKGARSGAVVVIEQETGEVWALVGAAFVSNPAWGQFDASQATRSPGSALKPFLYATALMQGDTAATWAWDLKLPHRDTWGIYMPENYDKNEYGPVRSREALAQSLNLSAVDVLHRTGIAATISTLQKCGISTFDRRASYFGLGLTLGSAGVKLLELTNAYATLARGGLYRPWTVMGGVGRNARRDPSLHHTMGNGAHNAATRVMPASVAFIIADIMSDNNARAPQFGLRSILNTPYWTAAKTGTSKGFRDNWTLGFNDRFTVGVWVGDPSGKPMRDVSGLVGAGPVWRKVMDRVSGRKGARPEAPRVGSGRVGGVVKRRVCHVSGKLATPLCEGGIDEWFVEGTAPTQSCSLHRRVRLQPNTGDIIPESCVDAIPGAQALPQQVVAVYPSPFDAWAVRSEKGIAERYAVECDLVREETDERMKSQKGTNEETVVLLNPAAHEVVRIDPDVPLALQALPLQAQVPIGYHGQVLFLVDDKPLIATRPPHTTWWPVQRGEHSIVAVLKDATDKRRSAPAMIRVY